MRRVWFECNREDSPASVRQLGFSKSRRMLLQACSGFLAAASVTPAFAAGESDPNAGRITTETITYPGKKSALKAFIARPKASGSKRPGVVIIHEIRGINNHFRDLAKKLALDGMIAMVPDLASGQNYGPEGSDEVRDFLQKYSVADVTAEVLAAIDRLKADPECSGAIGVIGFAWGGPVAAELAALGSQPVKAAVLYYSLPASIDLVPKFTAAVQFHYAEQDPHTQPQIDVIEKKLIGHSKIYEQYVYEGAKLNFANESLPKWYNKAEATLAWERTVAFLKRQLGA